jgi:hypothetical protein
MKNKTQELMNLMNEGYDIETIMMIMNIDDGELFDMMMEIYNHAITPASAQTFKVTFVTQSMNSEMVGHFSVNLN